jgi:glycosyltransferase involved in cell wall biosynthesis
MFVVNIPEFFLSHRLPLAIAAKKKGLIVHIATGPGQACQEIVNLGFHHHLVPIYRGGINPFADLSTLWGFFWLFRKIKPDLVHLVTIKPVLYGGLMARLARVPAVVSAISGLGTVFIDRGNKFFWIRRSVELLYRLAFGHSNSKVIFQNLDDRTALISMGAVDENNTLIIKGAGVLLSAYPMRPEPEGLPVVTFAARLLKDKGVMEFVEAARELRKRGAIARFWLAGSIDSGNLSSVSDWDLSLWIKEGLIEILGHQLDIPNLFAKSNIIVLPSYREGFPKTLIEAAACGRAVVTTDVPGCRDAIESEITGILVPVRDVSALADAIQSLINDSQRRKQMGKCGRVLAEREFTIEGVVNSHLSIYSELIANSEKH